MKQIKNENDFLGLLISQKDSSGNVDISKMSSDLGLTSIDISYMVKSLSEKDYIIQTDSRIIHLYPWGISAYKPLWKIIAMPIGKLLILTIKNLVLFIGGILSGLIVAYGTILLNEFL